jgi:hypothetical protein
MTLPNLTSVRRKWFFWLGAHVVVYAYMIPRLAVFLPDKRSGIPLTTVLIGLSMLGLASGFVLLKDPAKMHAQHLKRRPESSVRDTANDVGKVAFALMLTPMLYGTVDVVVTGRNHASLFVTVAILGAVAYWNLFGSALQFFANLPETKGPPSVGDGRA